MPIRYATEQGHVGIGVLIDIHEQGAGLLVPDLAPDVLHVWLQFLWFDDEMGLQGRVAFVRDTPDGFHVGLELYHYRARSLAFLTDLVIPYGMRKFRLDRRSGSLRHALAPREREWPAGRRRFLPMHVEQGTLRVWGITEDRTAHGAVLLLPDLVRREEPVTLTTWGRPGAHIAHVVGTETLRLPPVEMHRVVVHFTQVPFARAEAGRVVP